MSKNDRHERIIDFLKDEGALPVNTLSERLGVSHMTVRRDLELLSREGAVKLIHGGAALSPAALESENEAPYSLHDAGARRIPEKRRIARYASALIASGDTIVIDSGSTTEYLAGVLPDVDSLTILCYAMNIFAAIENPEQHEIVFGGGRYHANLMMFESPESIELIRRHRATRAFVSAAGVSPRFGVTCRNAFEQQTKRAVMESSIVKVLLADSSKLDVVHRDYFADLHEFDAIVTDSNLSDENREHLESFDFELHIV